MSSWLYRLPRAASRKQWTNEVNLDEVGGIPPNLAWEKIAGGPNCKICRTHDFMNYLHYVEHSSENFKFYLWYLDYVKRFDRLPRAQKDLSPPFVESKPVVKARPDPNNISTNNPPKRRPGRTDSNAETLVGHELSNLMMSKSVEGPDLFRLQQSQPFRAELTRVTSLFLTPNTDSPLELNLDDRDRLLCLRALSHTTHPSALKPAFKAAELCLRLQSHPNYCRRKLQNSRRERAHFMLAVGILFLLLGIVGAILLTLSNKPRAWRIFPALLCGLGALQLCGHRRQFCVQFWGFGYLRSLEPWEKSSYNTLHRVRTSPSPHRFNNPSSSTSSVAAIKDADQLSTMTTTTANTATSSSRTPKGEKSFASSLFTLDSGRTEEYEEEINVRIYHDRSYFSKMFEAGVREIDPEIRRIQLIIGSQLVATGACVMGIACAVLLPLPVVDKL